MAKIAIVHIHLVGETPLLMHSDRSVNSFDPLTKQLAVINSKRTRRTEDDKRDAERLEWELGMYFDENIGPYIPGENLKKCILDAAKTFRGGETVKKAVFPTDIMFSVIYKGPRTLQGMWDAVAPNGERTFVDIRSAGVKKNRVMRTRPRFPQWEIEASLRVFTSILDVEHFVQYLMHAGHSTGLGDYRPRYGRFHATVTDIDWQEALESVEKDTDDDADSTE